MFICGVVCSTLVLLRINGIVATCSSTMQQVTMCSLVLLQHIMFISVVVAVCINVAIVTFNVHECYYCHMFINVVVRICHQCCCYNVNGATTTLVFLLNINVHQCCYCNVGGVITTSMVLLNVSVHQCCCYYNIIVFTYRQCYCYNVDNFIQHQCSNNINIFTQCQCSLTCYCKTLVM